MDLPVLVMKILLLASSTPYLSICQQSCYKLLMDFVTVISIALG